MPDAPLSPDAWTAAADLFERYETTVARRLLGRYRGADPDAVADAFLAAVLEYVDAPPPPPGPPDVGRLLAERARQKLRVTLRGDGRRKLREEKYSADAVTNGRAVGPSPDDEAVDRELYERCRSAVAPTDVEKRALDLWLGGVTNPAELADRLGFPDGKPGTDQAARLLNLFSQRIGRQRKRLAPTEDDP